MSTHSSIFSFSRFSEFIALISLSTTLFLFIHTRDLTLQLDQERLRHEAEEGEQEDNPTAQQDLRERIEYYGQVSSGGDIA